MERQKNQQTSYAIRRGITLIDLMVAVSIMSIALLVFISASLTARGVIDKSQFLSIASQSGTTQAATSLANVNSLTVGTTNATVSGIPSGAVSTTISNYAENTTLKRADIAVSWGAASSKTTFSAGSLSIATLQSAPTHVSSIFNAGVNAAGALLSQGAIDSHFSILSYNGAPYVGAVYVPVPDNYWTARTSDSQWVSPSPNQSQNMPTGMYIYRGTFTLAGPTTGVTLTVHFSADDYLADLKLNGVSMISSPVGNWTTWNTIVLSTNFVTGVNTLDFYIPNPTAGPTGLQVELTPSS